MPEKRWPPMYGWSPWCEVQPAACASFPAQKACVRECGQRVLIVFPYIGGRYACDCQLGGKAALLEMCLCRLVGHLSFLSV